MKTVGQILKSQREKKKLTVNDVYKFIRIHPRFITALENDNYSGFEGRVHAKGFLKIYTDFLELNINEILALWRREYEHNLKDTGEEKFIKLRGLGTNKFSITPNLIFATVVFVLITAFFGYLFYQYKTYTGVPKLEIYYPKDNVVLDVDILDITGKTELDSDVFINSQKITLNVDGSFATSVKLKGGLNTLNISAVNKLGKETEVIRTIIYRPIVKIPPVGETTQTTQPAPSKK